MSRKTFNAWENVQMETITLPPKIISGRLKTAADGSDEYYAHLLSFIMLIEPGEFVLNPTFGVGAPEFDEDQIEVFALQAAQYVPEIRVTQTTPQYNDQGRVDIGVSFVQRGQ